MVSTRATPGGPGEEVESMTEFEELEYIVNSVLGRKGKEHAILLSCIHHGIETVLDLICHADVKGMKYMDKEGNIVPLQSGYIGLITQFREFEKQKQIPGVTLEWTDFNIDEFNEYRRNTFRQGNQTTAMAADGNGNVAVTTMRTTSTPLQEFEKGIRRDKGAYLALKDDKAWDSWRRSTIATARTHKCEEVFDPLYKPTTDDDKALFRQKQLFMYSVFDEKLQTDMGKNLVRTYELDYDAQKVYSLLAAHATTSTRADIESQHILTYITTARFGVGDSGWKGTGHSFILHWQNKVREYEDMVPRENYFSEGIKLTMLQNAVSGVPELHAVKVQAQYDKVRGLVALDYDKYCTLLLSTATNYDLKHAPQKARDRRAVNYHDQYYPDQEHDDAPNIDTEIFNLMVNAHDQRERAVTRLDQSVWYTLSPEDKERWSGFSDEVKASILKANSSSKPPGRKFETRPPGRFPPRHARSIFTKSARTTTYRVLPQSQSEMMMIMVSAWPKTMS